MILLPSLSAMDFSHPSLNTRPTPLDYCLFVCLLTIVIYKCMLASVHFSALALISDSGLILLAFLQYLHSWLPRAGASDPAAQERLGRSLVTIPE